MCRKKTGPPSRSSSRPPTATCARTTCRDFTNVKRNGKIAMNLPEGVTLVNAAIADENDDVMLVTAARPRHPLPDDRDPRLQIAAARPACAAFAWPTDDHVCRCRSSATSRRPRRTRGLPQAAPPDGRCHRRRGTDDDEEAVAAGQLSPERYAEMSAAEDLILTITKGGSGKLSSSHDYPVRGPWRHGRQGDGPGAMRGGRIVASFPVETVRPDHAGHLDRPVDPRAGGPDQLPLALGGRGQGLQRRQRTKKSSRSPASPNRAKSDEGA